MAKTPAKATEAKRTGEAVACSSLLPGLKRPKSISIPDKNINKMTPRSESNVRVSVWWTKFRPDCPRIIPTTISATAVGTLVILKRAIIIGITRAANMTINIDN